MAKAYVLSHINQASSKAGLGEVTLDDNPAAQSHAEDMRANCFLSHWGSDGMKPYMRYVLSGGQQYSDENISGYDFCPSNTNSYVNETITEHLD